MLHPETKSQIEVLHLRPARGVYFEIRAWPDPKLSTERRPEQFFVSIQKPNWVALDAQLDRWARGNFEIYIGVQPRSRQEGTKESVNTFTYIFADADDATLEALLAKLPVPPTLVVFSGYGYHVYYRTNTINRDEWERAQRGLFLFLKDVGADKQLGGDESRVLRLVPFANRKQETPVATKIVVNNGALEYPIAQLHRLFPFTPPATREEQMAELAAKFDGCIEDGAVMFIRHGCEPRLWKINFARTIVQLKALGLPEEEACKTLMMACCASGAKSADVWRMVDKAYGRDLSNKKSPYERCLLLMDKMPIAIQGKNGSNACLAVACECWRFDLSDGEALEVMRQYSTKCEPPWSEKELVHKLDSARKKVKTAGEWGGRLTQKKGDRPAPAPKPVKKLNPDIDSEPPPEVPLPGEPAASQAPSEQERPEPETRTTVTLISENLHKLRNFKWVEVADADDPTQTKRVIGYRSCREILESIYAVTGGWPRSLGGKLFFVSGKDIVTFDKSDAMFGKLYSYFHSQDWRSGQCLMPDGGTAQLVTKSEFFHHALDKAKFKYMGVSDLPHEPIFDDIYYFPFVRDAEENGVALNELLGKFNVETLTDKVLILACLLTGLWGGPPGKRPAFVFTSRHKQGAGKTTTIDKICELFGGYVKFDLDRNQQHRNTERQVDDQSMKLRWIRIDNVKQKIDGQDLEEQMTSPVISGRINYVGHRTRKNLMTFLIGVNSPQASRDISARSYFIHISKPITNSDFERWFLGFIATNRNPVINGLLNVLGEPQFKVEVPTVASDRWILWQEGVLGRAAMYLSGGDQDEASKLLIQIQAEMGQLRDEYDADKDEAADVRAAILKFVEKQSCSPTHQALQISSTSLCKFLRHEIWPSLSPSAISRQLKGMAGGEYLGELSHRRVSSGSVFRWLGKNTVAAENTQWTEVLGDEYMSGGYQGEGYRGQP